MCELLTESHSYFFFIVTIDMLDSRHFEALRGLFLSRRRGRTIAVILAAAAVVASASASQQWIVRIYIPARRTGERHIVERDSFDFSLDGDKQTAYVCRQILVANIVWTTRVPQSILEIFW